MPSPLRNCFLLPLMFGLAVLSLVACRPPEPRGAAGNDVTAAEAEDGLRIRIEFETTSVGPAPVTVHVLDGSQGVSGATVELQGDMSHAGMQPVIVTALPGEPGVYRADDFAFAMAGDWFVTARVKTADGRVAKHETFVTVSGR